MSDLVQRGSRNIAFHLGLWRHRARTRRERLSRAWRYFAGCLTADDAQRVMLDCRDPAGWHPLLILTVEDELYKNGWRGPTRAIAAPVVEALMELGAIGDLDDHLLRGKLTPPAASVTSRDAAHRILDRGWKIVDPENLVFDSGSECPPEVVIAVEQVLNRIGEYMRGKPFVG